MGTHGSHGDPGEPLETNHPKPTPIVKAAVKCGRIVSAKAMRKVYTKLRQRKGAHSGAHIEHRAIQPGAGVRSGGESIVWQGARRGQLNETQREWGRMQAVARRCQTEDRGSLMGRAEKLKCKAERKR
ncbi:unnamed protein product [Calypogeia fissa]